MSIMTHKHKVFISFHHDDQQYKEAFVRMMEGDIVDKSVHDEDIDDNDLKTETIRQKIRDDFIASATVTVVLVGKCTWQRKHVDWEIGSSLRDTDKNPRCGLLGILLPNHPNYGTGKYNSHLIPPRLADNCDKDYAHIYEWMDSPPTIRRCIDRAFITKGQTDPDNSRQQFRNNRTGTCSQGWSE